MMETDPPRESGSLQPQPREQGNRLYLYALVGACGLVVASLFLYLFAAKEFWPQAAPEQLSIDAYGQIEGLSPALGACYLANSVVTSLIIAISLGMAIGLSYVFGTFLYKKFRDSAADERNAFWMQISKKIYESKSPNISEIISDFRLYETIILDRRNIYWGLFLRATLALIVVGVIALLIAACKIEAQAGLPIITGIISFVIGQGSEAIHAGGSNVLVVADKKNKESETKSEN
jgi:hypothetical protein